MHRLLKGIQRKISDALSLDRVSEKYQVLVVNYVCFMVYTTLESVFVNTLLYTINNDISTVILYRAITFVASAMAMQLGAYIGQRKTPLVVIRLGGAMYFSMYILLFAGLDHMEALLVPVAVLSGCGGGLYWVGHNVLVPSYTTPNNRDVAISILGIVQGIMSLLVPVIAGVVISRMPGTTGYRVMFGVGMLAVAAQIWIQRNLHAVEQKQHTSMARLAIKMLLKKTSVRLMMAFEVCRGFRDGAFAFLLNMVLFEIITDESMVGLNTFFAGIAAIAGSWAYGRVVRSDARGKIVLLAAGVLTVVCLPLFWVMNPFTIMAFTAISGFVTLFIAHSCSNTAFDVMTQNETMRRCIGEVVAFREAALCVGRLLGLTVLTLFPHNQQGYVQAILVLTAAQLFTGTLLLFTERTLHRKKRNLVEEQA